jgi:hypothetical protein
MYDERIRLVDHLKRTRPFREREREKGRGRLDLLVQCDLLYRNDIASQQKKSRLAKDKKDMTFRQKGQTCESSACERTCVVGSAAGR